MSEPLRVRWDRTVIQSTGPDDDTIVCCLDQHGRPVALFLDDDLREALGLQLLLPDGDGEVDPQHLELQSENEQLRTELAQMRGCDCYPNPHDHADRCPIFRAAFPESGENW